MHEPPGQLSPGGAYVVVGTVDRDRDTFTLTELAVPAEECDGPRPGSEESQPAGTPCEEPDGGTLQQQLDEEYGVGVVVVSSALQPCPG